MRAHRWVASAPKLDAVGNVKFWECPSKTTKMLVALNTLTLHPGSTLSITFVVRNTGTKPCSYTAPYADIAPGPTTTTLQAGPCGSVRYEIATSHGHEVWPGPQLVNCPPWVSPGPGRHCLGHRHVEPGQAPNTDSRVPPASTR